jgi:hypothetical protein
MLDGTDCLVHRPIQNQQTYFSGRKTKHTIKYEVGGHPKTGNIVWVNAVVFLALYTI